MRIKLCYFFLASFGCVLFLGARTLTQVNYLPKVERQNNQLVVKVNTIRNDNDFYIYYRTTGLAGFQVRKMKMSEDGKAYYQLPTDTLYGKNIEYFILENTKLKSDAISPIFTIKNFTNKESPKVYFQQATPSGAGSTQPPTPWYKFLRTSGSLSSNYQMHEKKENTGSQKYSANGNISFTKNISNENYQFDFKTDFSYTDPVYSEEKESKVNLSSMNIKFTRKNHTVEAGDLYVSNLDFTTSSINKRGLQYGFKGKNFYLGSFYTNSQQKTKFEGFGIPPVTSNYFGATAGFFLGDEYNPMVKLKGMVIVGRDNLAESKTVVTNENETVSKGDIYSIGGEVNLFKNVLKLSGEHVTTSFGKGASKEQIIREDGTAWFGKADVNFKILRADATYKEVGSDFNSIANLFFQNDNKGLGSNVYLTIKTFTWHVEYTDMKKNLRENDINPMLHSKYVKTDFNWNIANCFTVGAEYSLNNLDYDDSSGLQTGSSDMDTISYAGTLGYRAGTTGLTLRLGRTESKTFSSNLDGSLSVNLMIGKFFRLDPSFTYQSTENFADSSTSKIYNLYISSELTFVPQLMSLSMTGTYRRNENSAYGNEDSIGGSANLNFYMAKFVKNKFYPTLILKSRYDERRAEGTRTSNLTIYLQVDISF